VISLQRRRAVGFTLIEVLLAMSIGVMIVLMVFFVLDSALRAGDRIEQSNRAGRIASAVFNQLSRDLTAAFMYQGVSNGFVGRDTGELDRIDFLTLNPSTIEMGQVASQPTEVGYQLQPIAGSEYHRLYRREAFYADQKPTSGGDLIPLYDGVFSFALSYHDGNGWQNAFLDKTILPRYIKVRLGIWVGEGLPPTRDKAKEYTYTQTFPVYAEGMTLDLELPKGEGEEEGGEEGS